MFGVWTHDKATLLEYFNFLNTIHPTIQFTIEHTADTGMSAFLDTKITISDTGAYTSELYVKPPVIIHFQSALPMSAKKNTVLSQMLRAVRVSSPGPPRARSLNIIEDLFIKNGYPSHVVARLKNEVLRRNTGGRREPDRSGPAPVYLTLPFLDDDLCRRTEGIVSRVGKLTAF